MDKEYFNFKEHFYKVRLLGGRVIIEVWDLYNDFLRLQVPYSNYSIVIDDENKTFQIIKG